MFRDEYERLLDEKRYEALSERSYELFKYIFGLLENGANPIALRDAKQMGTPDVAYHSYCQQHTLELEAYTTAILERLDYDVLTSDTECCGLAGSFSYKREYYELSVDVGDRLREPFEAPDTAERTVVASRTSCLEQLDAMLTRQPCHPISLLDPDEWD